MVREPDEAIHWLITMDHFKGFDQIIGYSFEDWKRCLEHGSDNIRLECCIDNLGTPQYLRAFQRDTPVEQASSYDCRSVVEGCLIAGGISSQKGKQACFFTLTHPMNIPMLTPHCEENESLMIPKKNEMENCTEYSTLFRSEICSRQRIDQFKEQCDIIVKTLCQPNVWWKWLKEI